MSLHAIGPLFETSAVPPTLGHSKDCMFKALPNWLHFLDHEAPSILYTVNASITCCMQLLKSPVIVTLDVKALHSHGTPTWGLIIVPD